MWDCTDRKGKPVPPGTYVCSLEGTIFWENRILYKAEIQVGGALAQAKPAAQYVPPAAKDIGEMVKNVHRVYSVALRRSHQPSYSPSAPP